MRLYLSSFRLGDHASRLVSMARGGTRAAVVANACDAMPASERAPRVAMECDALAELGFRPGELDLRDYFRKGDALRERLRAVDLIWVRGGNPFVLMRAFRESGLEQALPGLLAEDAFVYGGYSAGIAVLTPDLLGGELVDDPNVIPDGYNSTVITQCLSVLPFAVAPHYRSEHPESPDIERFVQYLIDQHQLFLALRDGQVIVQDGDHLEVLDRAANASA